ncbi:hypothetical protein K438DRAFT_1764316 [Mycena galopus ATCC 62051]|nr:hypothetical protein K438DRAFT_1764316 [Mycena galopus ATCC 62051]
MNSITAFLGILSWCARIFPLRLLASCPGISQLRNSGLRFWPQRPLLSSYASSISKPDVRLAPRVALNATALPELQELRSPAQGTGGLSDALPSARLILARDGQELKNLGWRSWCWDGSPGGVFSTLNAKHRTQRHEMPHSNAALLRAAGVRAKLARPRQRPIARVATQIATTARRVLTSCGRSHARYTNDPARSPGGHVTSEQVLAVGSPRITRAQLPRCPRTPRAAGVRAGPFFTAVPHALVYRATPSAPMSVPRLELPRLPTSLRPLVLATHGDAPRGHAPCVDDSSASHPAASPSTRASTPSAVRMHSRRHATFEQALATESTNAHPAARVHHTRLRVWTTQLTFALPVCARSWLVDAILHVLLGHRVRSLRGAPVAAPFIHLPRVTRVLPPRMRCNTPPSSNSPIQLREDSCGGHAALPCDADERGAPLSRSRATTLDAGERVNRQGSEAGIGKDREVEGDRIWEGTEGAVLAGRDRETAFIGLGVPLPSAPRLRSIRVIHPPCMDDPSLCATASPRVLQACHSVPAHPLALPDAVLPLIASTTARVRTLSAPQHVQHTRARCRRGRLEPRNNAGSARDKGMLRAAGVRAELACPGYYPAALCHAAAANVRACVSNHAICAQLAALAHRRPRGRPTPLRPILSTGPNAEEGRIPSPGRLGQAKGRALVRFYKNWYRSQKKAIITYSVKVCTDMPKKNGSNGANLYLGRW